MEETQRELFSTEFDESEKDLSDESAYSVNFIEELTPKHASWHFYLDPGQASFYPVINTFQK